MRDDVFEITMTGNIVSTFRRPWWQRLMFWRKPQRIVWDPKLGGGKTITWPAGFKRSAD